MKLIKALSLIIVILVISSVTLTNRSVDESLVVGELTREIASLENQNTILKAEVSATGSLGNLSLLIEEAGFSASPTLVTLPGTTSVASR